MMSDTRQELAQLRSEVSELRKEAIAKEERIKELLVAQRFERAQNLLSHIDALLDLIPDHERTSCSDENPKNYGRCARCTLLSFKESGHWDEDYDLRLSLEKD